MKRFKQAPLCEACGEKTAISFSYLSMPGGARRWWFTCMCTSGHERYYILFSAFFKSPAATVDWLAHMNGKGWMDWGDFMSMMRRFRKATGSFHVL